MSAQGTLALALDVGKAEACRGDRVFHLSSIVVVHTCVVVEVRHFSTLEKQLRTDIQRLVTLQLFVVECKYTAIAVLASGIQFFGGHKTVSPGRATQCKGRAGLAKRSSGIQNNASVHFYKRDNVQILFIYVFLNL